MKAQYIIVIYMFKVVILFNYHNYQNIDTKCIREEWNPDLHVTRQGRRKYLKIL